MKKRIKAMPELYVREQQHAKQGVNKKK